LGNMLIISIKSLEKLELVRLELSI